MFPANSALYVAFFFITTLFAFAPRKFTVTKAIPEGIRNNDIIVVHLQSEKVANEINKAENNENKRNYLRYLKPVIFVKDDIR